MGRRNTIPEKSKRDGKFQPVNVPHASAYAEVLHGWGAGRGDAPLLVSCRILYGARVFPSMHFGLRFSSVTLRGLQHHRHHSSKVSKRGQVSCECDAVTHCSILPGGDPQHHRCIPSIAPSTRYPAPSRINRMFHGSTSVTIAPSKGAHNYTTILSTAVPAWACMNGVYCPISIPQVSRAWGRGSTRAATSVGSSILVLPGDLLAEARRESQPRREGHADREA